MLARGTTVTIYEDPITKQKAEDNATIIDFVHALETGLDQYVVHFVGDAENFNVVRTIDQEAAAPIPTKREWLTCSRCGRKFIEGKTGSGSKCSRCARVRR